MSIRVAVSVKDLLNWSDDDNDILRTAEQPWNRGTVEPWNHGTIEWFMISTDHRGVRILEQGFGEYMIQSN